MSRTVRVGLLGAAGLLVGGFLSAQVGADKGAGPATEERPARHVPSREPGRRELDRREARKLYGLGLLREREHKLVEATRAFEAALRLDPDSAAVRKALVPLYLALDRVDDALGACRRALELDPGDYETGHLYARQLRRLGRRKEAVAALEQVARAAGLKERPDLRAAVWFDLGVLHEEGSEWAEAEGCYRRSAAVLEDPAPLVGQGAYTREEVVAQSAETYERIGRVCLRAGHVDRAVEAYRQARGKDPARSARLSYHLAQVYEGQGKCREALAHLEEYLRSQPQGTEGYELRIRLQQKLGLGADVVRALELSSSRDRHNGALKLLLAREYRKAGRLRDAEAVYAELLKGGPDAEVYRGLFGLYKDQGLAGERVLEALDRAVAASSPGGGRSGSAREAAKARAMLQALREDRELVKGVLVASHRRLLRGGRLAYTTRLLLASLALWARQLEVAEALYRSALKGEDFDPRAARESEVYAGLLRVLAMRRKHEAVIALCKQGLEKAQQTNRVMFHLDMAESYLMLDRLKAALAAADEAVHDAGEREALTAHRVRVQVLSALGRHERAVAECRGLLREYNQGGDLARVRISLSQALAAAGRHAESEEQLRLVLRADPNDALANNNLGYQLAERNKDLDEAERLVRKALELDRKERTTGSFVAVGADEDNPNYVDSLGWVLFRRGRLEEARAELERAARMPDGDEPVVWDHLGDVYFRLGQAGKAAGAWKKALALYEAGAGRKGEPRYKEIQDKIKLLEP
jgi:tetratricopeptide (TPR) repeat protein